MRIRFYQNFAARAYEYWGTAGTYTWVVPLGVTEIDVFAVGGGGSGRGIGMLAGSGGGGGYTATHKRSGNVDKLTNYAKKGDAIPVTTGEKLAIFIGAGGPEGDGGNNGYVTVLQRDPPSGPVLVAATGGLTGGSYSSGGDGGSGGGRTGTGTGQNNGGSDGNDGGTGWVSSGTTGGRGQRFTTRPFAELGSWINGARRYSTTGATPIANVPYAGGGGAANAGPGGNYGGGTGGAGGGAGNGVDGYGGGGGGRTAVGVGVNTGYRGGCGCLFIRWGFL